MAKYQIIVPEGSVLLRDTVTGQTLRLSATDGPLVIGTAELTLMAGLGGAPVAEQPYEARKAAEAEEKSKPVEQIEQVEQLDKAEKKDVASEVPTAESPSLAPSTNVTKKETSPSHNDDADGIKGATNPVEAEKEDNECNEALSPEAISRLAATARPSNTATEMPDEVMAALNRLSRVPPGFAEETAEEEPFLSNIMNLMQGAQVPQKTQNVQMPATTALPAERTLEAPLEALTQADFEATLTSLGHSRDNVEQELGFLREIESEPEDIEELEALDEALEKRYAAVSERFESWQLLQKKIDEERGITPEDGQ